MQQTIELIVVAGARPNFMKVAPIMEALRSRPDRFRPTLLHTGQHHDDALSKVFFDELGIPRPDHNLDVGSGSHAKQTADIMARFDGMLSERARTDAIIVVGDVNSTIACALVASKLGIRVVHVEAGLRSFDRTMPEEINRVLTDSISDWLFVSEASGMENLRSEGIAADRTYLVGNVMIDTLLRHRAKAAASTVLESLRVEPQHYGALTLHRPSNVDDPQTFRRILSAVGKIGQELPIVWPIHPRTRDRISKLGLADELQATDGLRLVEPLGYLDFLRLQSEARLVLTDSGGIQEETTVLRVPCLTIRDNTERPVTISHGTNQLVGTEFERIVDAARAILNAHFAIPRDLPELWDGSAAQRIVDVLDNRLHQ